MAILVSVNDIVVGENTPYAEFIITLSEAAQQEVSVSYTWGPDSAGSSDFTPFAGKLVFAPGVLAQTVRIAIVDDTLAERLESFTLRLSSATNAEIARQTGLATIVDNDTIADSGHRANLSVGDVVVDAGAGSAIFYVVLDKAAPASFSVGYSTANGSAAAGSDFTATSGVLAFSAGETVKAVSVALPREGGAEAAEMFSLVLGAVSGSAAGQIAVADGVGQAIIGRHGQTAVAAPVFSIDNPFVGEKDGFVDFVVSLSAPSVNQVSVSYDWGPVTASSNDFGIFSGKLLFAPGVTTQTVRVSIDDDALVEGLETFTLRLTSPVNAVVANPMGVATIVDNDTLADSSARAGLSVRDVVVDASADFAVFQVVLDKAASDSFGVAWQSANGTASAGSDYVAASGTLVFGPGETVKNVKLALPHGGVADPIEMFSLVLGAITGNAAGQVAIANGIGQATIGSHGQTAVARPALSVGNLFVGEKDGYADFVVSLSAPSLYQVSVSYDWSGGSAGSNDFGVFSDTLVFAPGVTTQTVRVSIKEDTLVEGLETFSLRLNNPTNAVIANPIGVATIVDNDTLADSASRAGLSVRDVVVDAASDTVTFHFALDKATSSGFSVAWQTANGSAGAGTDYAAASGTLSFAAGETAKSVTLALLHDGVAEPAETFSLVLGAVSGAAAGQVYVADRSAVATIGSHAQTPVALPAVSVSNPSAGEKDGFLDFIVTLSAPSQNQVSVSYDWANGTAGSNDFQPFGGSLVFLPGVTTQVVRVSLVADTITEGTESFVLRLNNPTNAVIANPVGTATILEIAAAAQVFGSAGTDTVNVGGLRENYTVTKTGDGFTVAAKAGAATPQLLIDVERIHFSDLNVALDINGTGGQAYRIYQAAFNRTPDSLGLGFWMNAMDKGTTLADVARGFMQSAEFVKVYGANPSSYDLVSKIYMNVLHRPAEAAGLDYWVKALETRAVTPAQALSLISESAENQAAVLTIIGDGFAYTPYG